MRDRQNKGDTVKLRIVADEKQIIFSAAKRHVSASKFIRQAALKASGQILHQRRRQWRVGDGILMADFTLEQHRALALAAARRRRAAAEDARPTQS